MKRGDNMKLFAKNDEPVQEEVQELESAEQENVELQATDAETAERVETAELEAETQEQAEELEAAETVEELEAGTQEEEEFTAKDQFEQIEKSFGTELAVKALKEGLSFEDCKEIHYSAMAEKLKQLEAENAELKAKKETAKPASFSTPVQEKKSFITMPGKK